MYVWKKVLRTVTPNPTGYRPHKHNPRPFPADDPCISTSCTEKRRSWAPVFQHPLYTAVHTFGRGSCAKVVDELLVRLLYAFHKLYYIFWGWKIRFLLGIFENFGVKIIVNFFVYVLGSANVPLTTRSPLSPCSIASGSLKRGPKVPSTYETAVQVGCGKKFLFCSIFIKI